MESHEHLRQLSDQELIAKIDSMAPNVNPGVDFYLRELHRRSEVESSDRMERMERMTESIQHLTKVITLLTGVSVVATVVAVVVTVANQ